MLNTTCMDFHAIWLIFCRSALLYCTHSTDPFKFAWLKRSICNSSDYHNQIRSITLSHSIHIICVCVSRGCSIICCQLFHKNPAKASFFIFITTVPSMSAHDWVRYEVSYSFVFTVHYCIITIMEICLKHWTCRMIVWSILARVYV